jgi:tRNA pseudouridine55 synthase
MDALLVIDKPAGITSHDAVARARRILGERSIGHLGTLDPLATGVLPLLIGRFTRLAQFFSAAEKTYEGTIRLGFATDTYDSEGDPTSPAVPVNVDLNAIKRAASGFLGEIEQLPPRFSAKKVGGIPAYKLARKHKDQPIDLNPVKVRVERFEIHAIDGDQVQFTAQVSAGTYVRALAHELGIKLGSGAHLAQLRRTISGDFSLEQAVTLEVLQELRTQADANGQILDELLRDFTIHPRKIVPQFPSVTVSQETAGLIGNGRAVNLPEFSRARLVKIFAGPDQLIAIATRIAGTLFQPKVVLK